MKHLIGILAICASVLMLAPAAGAQINVTTPQQGVTDSSNCSLQEAMYATQFGGPYALSQTDPDTTYQTGCTDPSQLWYQIVLPGGTLQFSQLWDGDGHNPFGPTATPIVCNFIDIVGNGTTLGWTGTGNSRLFAVGYASYSPTAGVKKTGTYCGAVVPSLTLQNVYVKGFQVKGGDGTGGGGGGLGAGGAIYIGRLPGKDAPNLTIQNSTFDGNTATGGSGSTCGLGGGQTDCGGGGGGVYGAGGGGIGGGGGGSRGDGGLPADGGGGGGGTVYGNGDANGNIGGAAGTYCGGNGGDRGNDGHNGSCPGGGGGGGGAADACITTSGFDDCGGNGGSGAYGGGGGGGNYEGNAGNGGFGGGGGGANCCSYAIQSGATIRGGYGGNGGFGAGGGMGQPSSVAFTTGSSGTFGGPAVGTSFTGWGGSGAGLGGAIFNDGGSVTIQNSTLANNKATGGGDNTCCGASEGGAIFSRDGSLTVESSTIANNNVGQNGVGGTGITVFGDGPAGSTSFTLHNTIIAKNGSPGAAYPCELLGKVAYSVAFYPIGNLITGDAVPQYSSSYMPQQDDCESNLASSFDPQLGTLQINSPGNTPTMAIQAGSPALDAGSDYWAAAEGITTDQRGVSRPYGPHVDIGAYEAQLTPLTMQVSPAGGGHTNPAVGLHEENPGAVINISATAFPGYYFLNWSGNVASASSASTTVTMDQAQTVTANFQLHDFHWDSVAPSPLILKLGGSASSTLTLSSLGNFADTISLASSGEPTGITGSLSPASLMPSAGGSASTTITLTAGPGAMPQNFMETVTGSSTGLSGALSHAAQWPITMSVSAADIVNVVNQNQALGCIDTSGIAQSLNAKLNTFQLLSTGGHVPPAVNVLAAFDYETQAQTGQHIASTCKDGSGTQFSPPQTLIADTTYLLSSIGAAQVKANPIVGSVISSGNKGISGVTVNLLNSSKTVIATAVTDAVGFYYFADTSSLIPGAGYTVTIAPPQGYKKTSTVQAFTWSDHPVKLANFLLN